MTVQQVIHEALQLTADERQRVVQTLTESLRRDTSDSGRARKRTSLPDLPVHSVGGILRPLGPDDDLLEEMLDLRYEHQVR